MRHLARCVPCAWSGCERRRIWSESEGAREHPSWSSPRSTPKTRAPLFPPGVLILLKAAQVMVSLWVFCVACLVASSEKKYPDGEPAKVRRCHLSVCSRYHDFAMQKAMEHPGPAAAKLKWLINRDPLARSKARTLFAQGKPWGRTSSRGWKHIARWNGKPRPKVCRLCLLNWWLSKTKTLTTTPTQMRGGGGGGGTTQDGVAASEAFV